MQKLIGCILILLSTTAGGFLYGVEQQQYLEQNPDIIACPAE